MQRRRSMDRVLLRLTALLLIAESLTLRPGTAQMGQTSPAVLPSYGLSSGTSSEHISVEVFADGIVFVQAQVNGKTGWFILDNASQGFTISSAYARRTSLSEGGSAVASGGGAATIYAGIVRDVEISMKGLVLTHRNAVVIALESLEPVLGHTVDGILGSPLFEEFAVAIDYENRYISIFRPDQYRAAKGDVSVPVRIDEHGFPFVDATIRLAGVQPISGTFLIDGGSNSYADLYKPFSKAHDLPPPGMKLLEEPGTSTGGQTQSRDGRARLMQVGRYAVKDVPITFAEDVEGLMASKDYAGLIGAEFLRRFTVVFDNPGKRIVLTPNRSYGEPADYDESGLRIRAEGPDFQRFVVARVVPGSAGADAGIEPGDVIESIDNRSASELMLSEIRKMFRRPNRHYSIAVMRAGQTRRVDVQLRSLL